MNNDTVLVEIICPYTFRTYDFVLYKHMKTGDIIEKIKDEITNFESNDNLFSSKINLQIFSDRYDYPLDVGEEISHYGIMSGDKLMLV